MSSAPALLMKTPNVAMRAFALAVVSLVLLVAVASRLAGTSSRRADELSPPPLPPPSSVAIVTVTSPFISEKYNRHIRNMADYASWNNYTFHIHTPFSDVSTPFVFDNDATPHWLKVPAIAAMLHHDAVVFLDVDSVILNKTFRVESLFRAHDVAVFSGGPMFSSSHFLALRKGDVANAFLQAWWQGRKARGDCHYDQGSFVYAMVASLQRIIYGYDHAPTVDELRRCAHLLQSPGGRRRFCTAFQTCLSNWARRWYAPLVRDCNELADSRMLRKHLWIWEWKKMRERARQVPFRWQCSFEDGTISWQGTKQTVFQGDLCLSSFSAHPIKRWEQIGCQGFADNG